VVVPAGGGGISRGRPLLTFLHGHGGSDGTCTENEAFFEALAKLGERAPVVTFPDGGDRATGTTAETDAGLTT
jgi:hypothetical protein